jgi:hypothetical protein
MHNSKAAVPTVCCRLQDTEMALLTATGASQLRYASALSVAYSSIDLPKHMGQRVSSLSLANCTCTMLQIPRQPRPSPSVGAALLSIAHCEDPDCSASYAPPRLHPLVYTVHLAASLHLLMPVSLLCCCFFARHSGVVAEDELKTR